MICGQPDVSRRVHADLLSKGNYSSLVPDLRELCVENLETVLDPSFPGAIVPVITLEGQICVYATAHEIAEWRRLNPLLVAFAGPSLTSYEGLPSCLPESGEMEDVIRTTNPLRVGILRIPDDLMSQGRVLRALIRARETVRRAPSMQRSVPEPTSQLLATFQDCLNVGSRDSAGIILGRLRDELRVDALNLKFLEFQLLAAFGDWKAILNLPGFASICVTRRPPAITALLLEALYLVHLDALFLAEDWNKLNEIYLEAVRPFALPMLVLPMPTSSNILVWRIYALEALTSGRDDLREAVGGHLSAIGWLARRFVDKASNATASSHSEASPLDDARAALVEADSVCSLESIANALASVGKLSPGDVQRLRDAEPFRSLLRIVADAGVPGCLPGNWIEWFSMAGNPDFSNALEIARRGKDEWVIDSMSADPNAVQKFVAALEGAQTNDLASERTSQALPFIVAWLKCDPEFPRSSMVPIYSSLLTLFALGASRGHGVYESSQILIHALLAVGLAEKDYRSVIADSEELAGAGFGRDMIYWLLEVIEDFLRFSAPDADARERFLHTALSKIAPIYPRLSSLQRGAICRIGDALGWKLETAIPSGIHSSTDDLASKLQGRRIAIYTLTESSSRQAKAALEEVEPTVIVDCSADHGGNQRLRALAENADIFVLTSLSAKHSATEFIREHRSNRTLLYAQGRGFSSILRAIEDHLKTLDA